MFRFLLRNLEITIKKNYRKLKFYSRLYPKGLRRRLIKFQFALENLNIMFWCFDGGVTSLPIPNRAIKPASADDSLYEAKVGRCQNNVFETK